MSGKWIQRLTLGVACVALFAAAGGPSYAASKINGKNIKKKSIPGSALKANTLTGAQIKESTLGIVPKAASADSATNATNATNASTAGSVNGVSTKKIAFFAANGTGATTIYSGGGITLTAACTAGDIVLTATTSKDNAVLHWGALGTAGGTTNFADGNGTAGNGTGVVGEDDDFDIAVPRNVTFDDSHIGQLNYSAPDGAIASIQLMSEEAGGISTCDVSGVGQSA
ncbi:MAG TPA: hypothetical protein VNT22_01020 [Baekduia sp.]|nr:hypothetical protein [Baekduia sp.]